MRKQLGLVEQWKIIPHMNSAYSVSNFGFVRSNARNVMLKIDYSRKTYPTIGIYQSGKFKRYSVAKFVADAFIPNEEGLSEVGYKDNNYQNMRADNLFWGQSQVLTEEVVAQILLIYSINNNIRKNKIAKYFCTTVKEVDAIVYRKKWSYVGIPIATGRENFKRFYNQGKGIDKFDKIERK